MNYCVCFILKCTEKNKIKGMRACMQYLVSLGEKNPPKVHCDFYWEQILRLGSVLSCLLILT